MSFTTVHEYKCQREIEALEKKLEGHQCSEATRVFDAYCGHEAICDQIQFLEVYKDHLHGKGLHADSWQWDYLPEECLPSRYEWEAAVQRAKYDAAQDAWFTAHPEIDRVTYEPPF